MKLWMDLSLAAIVALAASPLEPLRAQEARPPEWSRDVLDTFFDDARQALHGSRPDYRKEDAENAPAATSNSAESTSGFAWSRLIDAETLEAEVKRLNQAVATTVAQTGAFKGGGFKEARRDFSELAVLFAVTAQYDGHARWKVAAPGIRDELARTAASAKVGTDESLRAAAAANAVLSDVIRGDRPPSSNAGPAVLDWTIVASRPPLMQRMEIAHLKRLAKWLADPAAFRRHQSDVAHEAQIVALLAEVIRREAYEFSDDDTYVGYAQELKQAAVDLSAAAASGNFDRAQTATLRATKACADCHDGYRG